MAFVGSCQDMCPEAERQTRYGLYMSIFEKDQNNQPNEYAMVKEYRRSGADQEEPSSGDLRTVAALELTVDHLAGRIMDDPRSKQQETAIEWYDFLWDRLRAVRKDITQQNICDQRTALLVERCARFHVHSCYALNRVKDFDVDMNKRNLNDCLQMLRQMYSDLRTTSGTICPGEMEFQKYDILLHLNDDQLSSTILMKTSDHRSSDEMKFIFKVFSAYTNNDYYRFFRLMDRADYMTSCILSLYANKMRVQGLKTIIQACSMPRQATLYPVESAIECLGFDDERDLKAFVTKVGIDVQTKDDKNYLILNKDQVSIISRAVENLEPLKSYRLVESKMQEKLVGQLVYGDIMKLIPASDLPESVRAMPSKEIQPAVEANVVPPPVFSWFKDRLGTTEGEQRVYTETKRSATNANTSTRRRSSVTSQHEQDSVNINGETLIVSGERPEDEDVYKCKIENHLGQVETSECKLSTIGCDDAQHSPRDQVHELDEGDSLTLKVLDENHSKPCERWSEDQSSELTSVNNIKIEQVGQEHTLTIKQTNVDDSPLNEFLARALRKRSNLTRDELADRMPAGRFKVAPLASKRPTLKVPDNFNEQIAELPAKRRLSSLEPRQKLEEINNSIQDEEKVNKIFQELASMISQ